MPSSRDNHTNTSASKFADSATSSHLPGLDGFRAVAALSVVFEHGGYHPLLNGVTAFFVLSGFLITTLLLRERETAGAVSLPAFYARRTLRIFPAYYACVIASFLIDYVAGQPWPASLTRSAAAYVVNYYNAFHGHPSTSIAHLWSLGVEEQFYLVWPAVFILLTGIGIGALRVGLLTLVLVGTVWKATAFSSGLVTQAYLYNAFDSRFDNLAIGCLLASVTFHPGTARFARVVGAYGWTPLITLGLMLTLETLLSTIQRHIFGFTIYSVLVAILLVQLLELKNSRWWKWLEYPPVRFVGVISYPIYLYHQWGLGLGHWVPIPLTGQFAAGILFTIAGASASYFIVERPFLALRQHFKPGRRKADKPTRKSSPPARVPLSPRSHGVEYYRGGSKH